MRSVEFARGRKLTPAKEALKFTDVPQDAWYFNYLAEAVRLKVVQGNDGKFRPGDIVTRQEMAVILDNLMRLPDIKIDLAFNDAEHIDIWALQSVQNVNGNYLMNGDSERRLNPKSGATRAEFATAMTMTLKQLGQILPVETKEGRVSLDSGTKNVIFRIEGGETITLQCRNNALYEVLKKEAKGNNMVTLTYSSFAADGDLREVLRTGAPLKLFNGCPRCQ